MAVVTMLLANVVLVERRLLRLLLLRILVARGGGGLALASLSIDAPLPQVRGRPLCGACSIKATDNDGISRASLLAFRLFTNSPNDSLNSLRAWARASQSILCRFGCCSPGAGAGRRLRGGTLSKSAADSSRARRALAVQ